MTAKEFRKLLKAEGCAFKHATGHEKVFLGDRFTFMPRHGTDIGPYLFNKILKTSESRRRKNNATLPRDHQARR